MVALATVPDLEAVAGPQADTPRAERLLEIASAVVERWARRSFAKVVDDETTVSVCDGQLILPNGPVTAVGALTGPTGIAYADTAYTFTPDGRVSHSAINGDYFTGSGCGASTWACGTYTVTYTHGFDPIPDDVVLAVCQVVARHLSNPDGIRSESIGEAAVVYTIPGTGYALGLTLSPVDKDLLAPYRRTVSSVQMVR